MTPLTQPLPLRTTAVWSLYREAEVIPHRYGRTGGRLLQYDGTRTSFVWADHPVASIDEVLADGLPLGGWEYRAQADSTGRVVAFVVFAEAVEEGVALIARGQGKRHPRTGAALDNPGAIAWDILANIAGREVSEAQLADFAAEAAALGITCGGSLRGDQTVQGAVRDLAGSVGAVFAATARGLLSVWPGVEAGAAIGKATTGAASAEAQLQELATDITFRFAFEGGEPLRALRIEAPGVIAERGRRSIELDLPWVTSPRVALAVGTRLLQHRARPQWRVTCAVRGDLRVGDAIELGHPDLPVTGVHRVLERERELDAVDTVVGLRVPAGPVPSVRVVSQAERAASQPYAGAAVATQGDQRVITLREEDGRPIVGASVQLNGTITRRTDGGGRVSFPRLLMPAGEHTLTVTTADGRTLTTVVLVQ
jgi:hypothetical protein